MTTAAGIEDTQHVVLDTEFKVYSGGRYQKDPIRYRAFVRRIEPADRDDQDEFDWTVLTVGRAELDGLVPVFTEVMTQRAQGLESEDRILLFCRKP